MGEVSGKAIEILLVEDNPGDVTLAREIIKKSKIANTLYAVMTGEDAMSFLRKEGQFSDKPTPDVVLLDLSLPAMSGGDLLREIRKDQAFSKIRIFVITGLSEDQAGRKDILAFVDGFIEKPLSVKNFFEIVQFTDLFGISVVKKYR